MQFVIICVVALAVLGVVAALASIFTKGGSDEQVRQTEDCSTCSSAARGECKIGCLMEEQKARRRKEAMETE